MSAAIVRKMLRELDKGRQDEAIRIGRAALAPRPRKAMAGSTIKQDRAKKKAGRKAKTSAVYDAVMLRAAGLCEHCGNPPWRGGIVMDHFLGGSGRRTQQESEATCWALCRWPCNDLRTNNVPDAAYWNRRFAYHCTRYGYPLIRHVEHEGVRR